MGRVMRDIILCCIKGKQQCTCAAPGHFHSLALSPGQMFAAVGSIQILPKCDVATSNRFPKNIHPRIALYV